MDPTSAPGGEDSRAAGSPRLERFVPRILDTWDRDAAGRNWQVRDGTLCFVDISGFTALSERLARRGRIGAEELIGVLNHVFGAMLAEAYRRSGSLIKFGGDALFLLFSGPDHALQAASAAVDLRRCLREGANLPTSAGRLELRMSVGLESGPIHLFRVGALHHELLVAGPTATRVAELESIADAGEIIIGAGARGRLPPGAADRHKGPGHRLSWRTARVAASGLVERQVDDLRAVEAAVPLELRDVLASGAIENEHRNGVIAFVEFQGIDALLDEQGPAVVGEVIDELVTAAEEEAREEGVTFLATDLAKDGGRILFSAGAPFTKEDDEGRMLRTCRALMDRDLRLPCRIGVNRGHVFTGEVGTAFRSTYVVMGTTTNLAARMMAAAPFGEIYAAPSVVSRARTRFETTLVPPFAAKGASEPVRVLSIGAPLGTRLDDGADLPLVGRRDELAALVAALRAGLEGNGGGAVLVGDRGMGKTRLVTEAIAALGPVRSFTIQADPYAVASPYRAFRDAARRLFGIDRASNTEMAAALRAAVAALDDTLLPLAPLLGDVTHVELEPTPQSARIDPRYRAERLADLVVELLVRAFDGPTVLVVEDAHWMDDASLVLLRRIERAAQDQPWAMLVTRRPQAGGYAPSGPRRIELAPLADGEVVAAITAATPSVPLRSDDVQRVASRLGGNPLFLVEIVHAIETHGGIEHLPDSVEEVMGARVDELPALPRQVLRTASVLGRSFRPPILAEVLGITGGFDAATQSALAEFLEPDGTERLRFRHALLRDALYGSLSFRRRQELHRRAGAAIERAAGADWPAVADLLGIHAFEGRDHAAAFRFARAAGDEARARFANLDASVHYQRALDAARQLSLPAEEVAALWRCIGDVLQLAGRYGPAHEAHARAYRLLQEPLARGEVLLARADCLAQAGRHRTALALLGRARRMLAGDHRQEARRLDARLAAFVSTCRLYQQRPEQALRDATAAIDAARAAEEPAALAVAMLRHDVAQLMLGRFERAQQLEAAAEIFRSLGDLASLGSVTNALGGRAFFLGEWEAARAWYEETQRTDALIGNEAGSAAAAANVAEILVFQRRFDEAIAILSSARRTALASEYRDLLSFIGINLGRALAGCGRAAEAITVLEETLDVAEALGHGSSLAEARLELASVLLDRGELPAAEQHAAAVPEDLRQRFAPASALVAVKATLLREPLEPAYRAVGAALDEVRSAAAAYELVPLLLLGRRLAPDVTVAAQHDAELAALAQRYRIRLDPLGGDQTVPGPGRPPERSAS